MQKLTIDSQNVRDRGINVINMCPLNDRIRMAKTRHVFLTRTTWDRVGGLPGKPPPNKQFILMELCVFAFSQA